MRNIDSNSIGSELTAHLASQMQRTLAQAVKSGTASAASSANGTFAKHLLQQYDADHNGSLDASELKSAFAAPDADGTAPTARSAAGLESVDSIWARARAKSLADGNGPADALLKAFNVRDAELRAHPKKGRSSDPFGF